MTKAELKEKIKSLIPGSTVHLSDRNGDNQHFEAIVISDFFEGKTLMQQHKSIMNPLKEELKQEVHALALRTYTLARWETVKDQFNLPEN